MTLLSHKEAKRHKHSSHKPTLWHTWYDNPVRLTPHWWLFTWSLFNCVLFLPTIPWSKVSATNRHLPRAFASDWTITRACAICLCGDRTLCCCSCTFSIPWGWRVRHFVLQGNWWNRSLDRYFQELISWSQSLHFLISRKALNPFMMTSAPLD